MSDEVLFVFTDSTLDGKDPRQGPERSECSEIICPQHVEHQGKLLSEEVCERNLEGMACKREASIYASMAGSKIKNPNDTQAEGRYEMFTAFRERLRTKSQSKALIESRHGPTDKSCKENASVASATVFVPVERNFGFACSR